MGPSSGLFSAVAFSRLFRFHHQKKYSQKSGVKMDDFVKTKLQEWNLSALTDILEGMYLVFYQYYVCTGYFCPKKASS